MDPSWVRRHNRNICTDSRTLPRAAFPSLPLDHPPLANSTRQTGTPSHPIDTTGSENDEVDGSNSEDTIDDDTTDQDTVDAAETFGGDRHESPLWTERQLSSNNSMISRAVRYHFGEHHTQDGGVEDEVLAEHKLLCDAGLLPDVRNPRKIRPRSVNMVQLRNTNRELRRKKEMLIRKLCKLGYESSDIEACVLWKTAEILPEKPGNIDAYCLSNYNLTWLNKRLKFLLKNRRAVVNAKEKFLAEAASPADSPVVKPRKRRYRQSIPEAIDPPELLEHSDESPPGSRRANSSPSTSITADPTHDGWYNLLGSNPHKDDQTHNTSLPFQAGSLTLQYYTELGGD